MPTFSFQCDNCGYLGEDYKPISFPKVSKCPNCHQETYIKLIGSGGGLIFKGEGFYINDSKKAKVEQSIKEAEADNG